MQQHYSLWQATAIKKLFAKLWTNYRAHVPQVGQVEDALRSRGEVWSEDHVAFRALPSAHTGAHVIRQAFEILGYEYAEGLRFDDKKLDAFWLCPPGDKDVPSAQVFPKVFVSQLDLSSFSQNFLQILQRYTDKVTNSPIAYWQQLAENCSKNAIAGNANELVTAIDHLVDSLFLYFTNGAPWGLVCFADYELIRKESEYAAWTLVYGPQANHFTVSVHLMKQFGSLEQFNEEIENQLSIALNEAGGGKVKGGEAFRLAQSATLAAPRQVLFQDCVCTLPYAFIEFAYRFAITSAAASPNPKTWSQFYQGFVVSNADKIFESTNLR